MAILFSRTESLYNFGRVYNGDNLSEIILIRTSGLGVDVISLLVSSVDNLCKKFGPRCRA